MSAVLLSLGSGDQHHLRAAGRLALALPRRRDVVERQALDVDDDVAAGDVLGQAQVGLAAAARPAGGPRRSRGRRATWSGSAARGRRERLRRPCCRPRRGAPRRAATDMAANAGRAPQHVDGHVDVAARGLAEGGGEVVGRVDLDDRVGAPLEQVRQAARPRGRPRRRARRRASSRPAPRRCPTAPVAPSTSTVSPGCSSARHASASQAAEAGVAERGRDGVVDALGDVEQRVGAARACARPSSRGARRSRRSTRAGRRRAGPRRRCRRRTAAAAGPCRRCPIALWRSRWCSAAARTSTADRAGTASPGSANSSTRGVAPCSRRTAARTGLPTGSCRPGCRHRPG